MVLKRVSAFLTAGVLLLSPVIAAAQNAESTAAPAPGSLTDQFLHDGTLDLGSVTSGLPGTVDCFQYYTFGSVQANLSSSVTGVVSGTPVTFSGTLKNNNPYPVVDGALYVKIFKSRGSSNDGNGPDVVDQFLVKGDIVIPAGGSVPIVFQWKVPSYARSGDYQVATFFTTSRKFNLLGLSFTDDVVGNTVPFSVSAEQTTGVGFDKAGVSVNGEAYHFAAFPPRVSATEPVVLDAVVKNTTGTDASAKLAWEVYQWDAQLRENTVQEKTEVVTVPAHSSKKVSITVTDAKYPVYLAVGTLQWQDTKSIIGVRFGRDGVDRTRINFPGVTAFPLKAGQETTLFSCLHNSGQSDIVPNGRLDLTLTDLSGNVIHSYTYKGDVTGAMMGVADKFMPTKNYDKFILDARLYQGDQAIDEAHLYYDCDTIAPGSCSATPLAGGSETLTSFVLSLIYIVAGLVALALVVWIWKRTRRVPPPPPTPLGGHMGPQL